MNKSIFEYSDYKDYLKQLSLERPTGFISQLSKAAGCQRSYISQALNSHVHLTPDHIYGISVFLGLTEVESDMLQLLLEKGRASSSAYRNKIQEKIKIVIKDHNRLTNRIHKSDGQIIAGDIGAIYYSSWHFAAIHIAASSDILNSHKDIARYLGLSDELVYKTLNQLKGWGLVDFIKDKWIYSKGVSLHLEDQSPYTKPNHINWRLRAMANPFSESSVHYSSVFTISKDDVSTLKKQILTLIEEQRKQIKKSGSEEVVSFCCDFFIPST